MEKSRRYQPAIRGIVGGVVLVAALAAFLGSSQSEAGIKQRTIAFWEARIQGDDLTAYQYETYAHTGEMTVTQYIQGSVTDAVKYRAYTIDEHPGAGKRSLGQGQPAISVCISNHRRYTVSHGLERTLGAS